MLRRNEVSSIVLRSAVPGSRAVFLVETRSPEDRRKLRELFEALAELGEVVPLAEGPMMMSNVTDCAADDVHVGMPVEAHFVTADDGIGVPFFRPG